MNSRSFTLVVITIITIINDYVAFVEYNTYYRNCFQTKLEYDNIHEKYYV